MKFNTLLLTAFASLVSAQSASSAAARGGAPSTPPTPAGPAAPPLTFLYTSFVNIAAPIDNGLGPYGNRVTIPITGGNFTGPLLSGTYNQPIHKYP